MGVSHIVVKKGGIFWGDGEILGCRIFRGGGYIPGGRGRFWEGGIDSGSIAYSCRKRGYILERWGRLWEPHLI